MYNKNMKDFSKKNILENDMLGSFLSSFNPLKYDEICSQEMHDVMKYLIVLILLSSFIGLIIAVPRIMNIPSEIEKDLGSFTLLKFNPEYTMIRPLLIPQKNPMIAMDLREQPDKLDAMIMINKTTISYQAMPFVTKRINSSEFSDPLAHKETIKGFVIFLIIMLAPLIILTALAYLLLKYLIIALIITSVAYGMLRIAQYKYRFSKLFKIAIFASTIMIVIEILNLGWNFNLYYIPAIISLAMYAIAVAFSREG